ncbi:MAG TPA: thioredoxin [Bacteroidales bacterium]|nr:thioredoxin [Bacteroidales bacterium]HPT10735.1 thioredoxin [Bacteroidales bacterium]
MKKLAFTILFLSTLTLNACNNTSSAGDGAGKNPEGEVVQLTAANFKQLVWDYTKNPQEWSYKGDQPCIIDFYADWCRPCKMIAPIMVELSKEYKGKVRIYKINTDEQRELAKLFNVSSIPAVLFVPKNGKPQMAVGAMQKASYVEAIQQVLNVK